MNLSVLRGPAVLHNFISLLLLFTKYKRGIQPDTYLIQ